jgi:hypothetical protein
VTVTVVATGVTV